jgi:hypothetical protein
VKLLLEETVNDPLRKRAFTLADTSRVAGYRAEAHHPVSSHSLAGWQLRCGRLLPSFGAHAQFRPYDAALLVME